MMTHGPSLVEMHLSVQDLSWMPERIYNAELAIHMPEYHDGRLLDPASPDESTRQYTSQIYAQASRRGAAWAPFFRGARPKAVFHPGGMGVEPASEGAIRLMRDQLDKTIREMKEAAGEDVEILIENLPAHCWFFGGDWIANIFTSGRELAEACEKHGIGATLDLCHLFLAANDRKYDVMDEIRAAKPYVRHVHYSDARGIDGEGLQIGSGDMPLSQYLAELADLNVKAVPEIWYGHEYEGAGFVTAWKEAEKMMAGVPVG